MAAALIHETFAIDAFVMGAPDGQKELALEGSPKAMSLLGEVQVCTGWVR